MKRILLLIFACLLLSAQLLSAQSVKRFMRALAKPDSLYYSSIKIEEHGNVGRVLDRIEDATQKSIEGYRIQIFFDNGQNARSAAREIVTQFAELFPSVPSYMTYETPSWVVAVGNCLTSEEALILWGRVKNNFNRAFVTRANIPVEELLR